MPLVVDSTSERQGFTDLHRTLAPRTAPDEANARPVDPGRVRDRCPGPCSAELTSVRSRRAFGALNALRAALRAVLGDLVSIPA
jgi:hypothetical protein